MFEVSDRSRVSAPLPPAGEAVPGIASLGHLRFGTFRRFRTATGADAFPRGLPTRGARPVEQTSLAEALTRRWEDDRHIVLYTSELPYRINQDASARARAEVRLLAFDVDNHDDAPAWLEGERAKIAALVLEHPGAFAHTTRRGWRAFYALPRPFPIASEADKQAFTLLYARVAAYVHARFGIAIDSALVRWNQPIRLPHVIRDGRVLDAEILAGDPTALEAFELPEDAPAKPDLRTLAREVPSWGGVAKQWQPKRELFRVASSAWDHIPLPPYADRLAAASRWAREEAPRAVQGQHGRATARSAAASLRVGFALEREDVERLLTGPYNGRRCSPRWAEPELEELRGMARTVARTPSQPVGFLLTRDRTGLEAARATLAHSSLARTVVPLSDVPARLVAAVTTHRALVLRATYGAGKTHTISQYIARQTTGRVLVVVPRHELGRAWVEALVAAGEPSVAYHASVVQRRDGEGRRHCDNKVALRLYARGGDVRRDVCPSCPRASTCPAFAERANAQARVHVLPREMLAALEVTDEDLVVFDDAAVDLLAWHRLPVRRLRRLAGADARALPVRQRAYVSAFVRALLAGPRQADDIARAALTSDAAAASASSGEPLRRLAARATEGQRAPHVAADVLAEGGDELEATLRDTGTLRDVLRFAEACAQGGAVHWGDAVRSVHGESFAAQLLRAHGGRLVVLDAAANVEELRALRPELHVERIDVGDAGDVERSLLFVQNAHRSALKKGAERQAALELWLDAALGRLDARRARRPVMVTYKELVPELRAHPKVTAWLAANPRREVRFAHYGNLRGSNRFRHVDAVVTLGDPWLNGDDVLGRAAWLELPDEPSYRVALATAELGQAHGRSRSVRRRRRLTHVHVGRLVPDGWGEGSELAPLGGAPERVRGEASRIEFAALVAAAGGNRAAAALLACSSSAVAAWRTGTRSLPRSALEGLRVTSTSSATTTASSVERGGGAAAGPTEGMDTVLCDQRSKARVHSASGQGHRWAGRVEETVETGPQDRSPPAAPRKILTPPPEREPACERGEELPGGRSSEGHGSATPPPIGRFGRALVVPPDAGGDVTDDGEAAAARIVAMLTALEAQGPAGRELPPERRHDEREDDGHGSPARPFRSCG